MTGDAWSTALAGYADWSDGRTADALAKFDAAHRLDPADDEIALVRTMLIVEGSDESAGCAAVDALAARLHVDLDALRTDLAAIGFPTDARTLLMNGFPHARNFFESRMREANEKALRAADPARAKRERERIERECDEALAELRQWFRPEGVPPELTALTEWALRIGVGDDMCRAHILSRLSDDDVRAASAAVAGHALQLQSWLDSFGDEPLSDEAAALMYLALAMEELPSR